MNVGMCFDRSLPVPLVEQLVDAGADDVAFFPGPTVELAQTSSTCVGSPPRSGTEQRGACEPRPQARCVYCVGVIAQRSVRVMSSPAGRSATVSVTGSHGSRSGQRVQRGSSATAAATTRP